MRWLLVAIVLVVKLGVDGLVLVLGALIGRLHVFDVGRLDLRCLVGDRLVLAVLDQAGLDVVQVHLVLRGSLARPPSYFVEG